MNLVLRLRRLRRCRHWVITGVPDRYRKWAGPYNKSSEAIEDKKGLLTFYQANPEFARMDDEPLTLAPPNTSLGRLIVKTRAAMEHLRPDTLEWFQSRMEYLLHLAEQRRLPEEA